MLKLTSDTVTPVISLVPDMPVSGDDGLKQVVAARTTRPDDRAVRLNMMDYGDIRLPPHQNLLSGTAAIRMYYTARNKGKTVWIGLRDWSLI